MSEANDQIAGYTIVREIGRGGMGVVHLAHDPKLDRPVAIKALPADFAHEPERLARFEREARVLASLSHGNIATVYGLEQVDGCRYLVMEFVEGEPLSERLADGPLPVSEALMICAQVAAGVEAAHEAGVVHRDLKPGNIIVRPDGTAKVLDFGLAREMPERSSRSAVAGAETVPPSAVTGEGVTIGTPGYMSPEQVRGMTVDRRTDNFAFGCILYECLTGRLAFHGQTATDSIAAILEREPDWSLLPDGTPPTVQLLLRRCLQKDRRRRLRDIGDARIDIEQAIDDPSSTVLGLAELTLRGTRRTRPSAAHVAVGALIALVAAAAAWILKPTPATPDVPVVRTSVAIGTSRFRPQFALAPDGSRLVFVATPIAAADAGPDDGPRTQLWQRRFDSFEPSPITGTEHGEYPVFSPDSARILFVADPEPGGGHRANLRVVGLDGRPPLTIHRAAIDHAAPTWLSNDEVAFIDGGDQRTIWRLSARGGEPRLVAELPEDGELPLHITALPGGEWIAVTFRSRRGMSRRAPGGIELLSVATGERHPFVTDGRIPVILPAGVMLFARETTLLASEVDLAAAPPRPTGDLVTVLSGLSEGYGEQYAVSAAGHLAYLPGGSSSSGNSTLVTVDLQGNEEPFPAEPRRYFGVSALSPDGNRMACVIMDEEDVPGVWIMELDTGAIRRMSPEEEASFGGAWLPDGRLLFTGRDPEAGTATPMVTEMRRSAEPEPLFPDGPGHETLTGIRGFEATPDGTGLVFAATPEGRDDADIFVRPIDGSAPARSLIASRSNERAPAISPDGRWLAFVSDESGRDEVSVCPLVEAADGPGLEAGDETVQVSRSGGRAPAWTADRSRLFFQADQVLFVVEIDRSEGGLAATEPRKVVELDGYGFGYTPMPDGDRLLMVKRDRREETPADQLQLVFNWIEELNR